ncbi:protein serine threonine phosphatase 2C [Thelephora ganbajun]|uniref:Protein serine threonine phosphatase 2C n=1 Tax=Thelephora ganbajun TaxID=370292 RepID=A0ACB6ZU76_THEGA|nr:protein serine threonine phosphatase 2C [Thelephora ganbajun]
MASRDHHPLAQYPTAQTDLGWGAGAGPWDYRKVPEPTLSSLLAAVAKPNTIGSVDIIDFQPQAEQSSEDLHIVQDWTLQNGTWKLLAVFDGHAGGETAKHIAATLPGQLQSALVDALVRSEWKIDPISVSNLLSEAIISYDDSLMNDLYDLFPGGLEELEKLSDNEVKAVIHDSATDGPNHAKVARCMQGSTALVSLVDPDRDNIWVASVGDCQAVLGVRVDPSTWRVSTLSANHNATVPSEIEALRSAHPGESEVVLNNRVLGGIAVTRDTSAVGDHIFKVDKLWCSKVFMNAEQPFKFHSAKPETLISRIYTPPYLSNKPDMQHVNLTQIKAFAGGEITLILCSDGLVDLFDARDEPDLKKVAERWMELGSAANPGNPKDVYANGALRVLREGLGGKDEDRVAQLLTVEMSGKWLDDITTLVYRLQ